MFLLDWFTLDDIVPLIVLICLLIFIGGQMTRPTADTRRITRRVAYTTFVLYAGTALYSWGASGPVHVLGIVLRASLATGLAFGLTMIAIPSIEGIAALAKVKTAPKSEPWTPPLSRVEPKAIVKPDNSEHERKAQVDD